MGGMPGGYNGVPPPTHVQVQQVPPQMQSSTLVQQPPAAHQIPPVQQVPPVQQLPQMAQVPLVQQVPQMQVPPMARATGVPGIVWGGGRDAGRIV